jgi:hypothetical protein
VTSIIWDNWGSSTVAQRVQLERYIKFSVDYLNSLLIHPIDFDIRAGALDLGDSIIAQARSDIHPLDRVPETYAPVGMIQASGGIEVPGTDAFIQFNHAMWSGLFFDPTPFDGLDVPSDQVDLISTITHELLHAIGFNNFTDDGSGQNELGVTLPMDRFMFLSPEGIMYFTGEEAMAVHGGPVPLAYGTLAHLDAPNDLMHPYAYAGYRDYVSDLNLAMLRDMGVPTIRGNEFVATAGADHFVGNNASDHFVVGGPSQAGTVSRFEGALGFDTVTYWGGRSDFAVAFDGSEVRIGHGGSVDVLTSIERVEFADGALLFDFDSANADAIYRLYGGAFDRTPDEDGLRYWTFGWLNSGGSLEDAAWMFIGSDEFIDTYGDWLSDETFVAQLYRNVLGREDSGSGIAYWTDYLASGLGDRGNVLVQFTQLPEYVGLSAADLENGYWVTA